MVAGDGFRPVLLVIAFNRGPQRSAPGIAAPEGRIRRAMVQDNM